MREHKSMYLKYIPIGGYCASWRICSHLNNRFDNLYLGRSAFFNYNSDRTNPVEMLCDFLDLYFQNKLFDNIMSKNSDICNDKRWDHCFDLKITDRYYLVTHIDHYDYKNIEYLISYIKYFFTCTCKYYIYIARRNFLTNIDLYMKLNRLLKRISKNSNLVIMVKKDNIDYSSLYKENIHVFEFNEYPKYYNNTIWKFDLDSYTRLCKFFKFQFSKDLFLDI